MEFSLTVLLIHHSHVRQWYGFTNLLLLNPEISSTHFKPSDGKSGRCLWQLFQERVGQSQNRGQALIINL